MSKHQFKPKSYPPLSQALIKDLTVEQLKRLINSEVKTANSRLRRLRQSGEIDSPIVNDKWRNLNNSPFGTPSGIFSRSVKGKSAEQLQQQYLTIRQFLSSPSTKQQIAEYKKEYAKRTHIAEDMVDPVMRIFKRLYALGYTQTDVNSEVYQLIEDSIDEGKPLEDIVDLCVEQIEGAKRIQSDNAQNFRQKNAHRRWRVR